MYEYISIKKATALSKKEPCLNPENPIGASVYEYNAMAVNGKRAYTNQDEIPEYGQQGILDPHQVSYYRLFINGVLQPKINYEVTKGLLILKTQDLPLEGSPLVISFVTLLDATVKELNTARVEGHIPSGLICHGPVQTHKIVVNPLEQTAFTLENIILSGSNSMVAGQVAVWKYKLHVTNTGETPLHDLLLTDCLLLDQILSIDVFPPSQGTATLEEQHITWQLGTLNGGGAASIEIQVEGLFRGAGSRSLNTSVVSGGGGLASLQSPVVSGEVIEVASGISLSTNLTAGPLLINQQKAAVWRIQIRAVNLSKWPVSNLLITDQLMIDHIDKMNLVSLSQGTVSLTEKKVLWHVGILEEGVTAILVLELKGSFTRNGVQILDQVRGTGSIEDGTIEIFMGPCSDWGIMVLPFKKIEQLSLTLEKSILAWPLVTFSGQLRKWCFTLKLTNPFSHTLWNLMVTDTLLLDQMMEVKAVSLPSGTMTYADDTFIWRLPSLLPGSTITGVFEITGIFHGLGLRSLDRALAAGSFSHTTDCVLSQIAAGPQIKVLDFLRNREDTCILTEKVYDQCQQSYCFKMIQLSLENQHFRKICFQNGQIVKSSLRISVVRDRPQFRRVELMIKIPYEITTAQGLPLKGHLPAIQCSAVLFMPQSRDELIFHIEVQTNTSLLFEPEVLKETLHFKAQVSMLIAAVGKIQLFIPAFGSCLEPPSCEDFKHQEIHSYSEKNDFQTFYPEQILEKNNPSYSPFYGSMMKKPCILQCPPLFGELMLEKRLVAGPLRIASHTPYTWRVEFKITNKGLGSVNQVVMIDTLYLDQLIEVKMISLTQGAATQDHHQIIWQAGSVSGGAVVVLTAEIVGSFNSPIHVHSFQFNVVSDGTKRSFTKEDELEMYGKSGIPDPDHVSYFNLFINGVLQPQTNYKVQKGLLTLTTADIPLTGVPIILESVIINYLNQKRLSAADLRYNAYADKKHVYTDEDELTMYGNTGIPDPQKVSYQNLFVNGVLQPSVNYQVEPKQLTLTTTDLPLEKSPIILQSISVFCQPDEPPHSN